MERPRDAETPSLSSTAALEKSHGEALSCKSQSGFFLNNEAIVTIHDKVAMIPERKFRNRAVEQEMNVVNNELNSELKALSGDAPKIQTALAYFLAAAKFAKRFFLIAPFHNGNVVTLQAVVATLMPADIDEHNKAALVQLLQVAEDREVANFLISIAAPSPGAVSAQPSSAVELPQSAVKTEVAAATRIMLGFQHGGFKDETYTKNLLMKPKLAAVAERIKQGFEEEKYTKNPEKFNKLSNGQCPKLMVIACSDPRVCPATILGLQLGEAFIVRSVANIVPPPEDAGGYPGTSAAVEYAVRELKVEHILVFGHSRCGGIKALVTKKARSSTCIQNWIEPARASTLGSAEQTEIRCTKCEKESVDVSLSNLLAFPFVTSSKVGLHGGYYNFDDGSFEYWTHGADRKAGKLTRSMTNSRMI